MKGKQNRSRNNKLPSVIGVKQVNFPQQFDVRPTFRIRSRYKFAATVTNQEITRADLLNQFLAVSAETTSAQATRVFGGVRLVELELYVMTDGSTSEPELQTGNISFHGATHSRTKEYIVVGNSNQPGHLRIKPPRESLSSFWMDTNGSSLSEQVFEIVSMPSGAYMDVVMDAYLADAADQGTEAATEVTLTAVVASGIYHAFLDSVDTGVPQGWTAVAVASVPLVKGAEATEAVPPKYARVNARAVRK